MRAILALAVIALSACVMGPAQYLVLRTGLMNPASIPRWWHGIVLRAMGVRVRVRGAIAAARPLMIASNHVSWTDIMVLGSRADVCFIAKSEVGRWPVFGWLARLQRTVFVERERRGRSAEQANEVARRLAKGDVMVLFPEGSTSDGNLILPFKSTLFGAATLAVGSGVADRVFIQPLAISYVRIHGMPMGRQHRRLVAWIGDMDLVPHLTALLREGAVDVELVFGDPVEFTGSSDRKAVARQLEAAVRAMLADSTRQALLRKAG